jgi:hypothetical protein
MLSLILSLSLLGGGALSGAPERPSAAPDFEIYRAIPLASIAGGFIGDFFPLGAPDGVRDALILMDHGGTILVTDLSLFEVDTANAVVKIRVAGGEDKPTVFRTVYVDREGRTHEVVTDCRKYSTFKRCAEQHGAALAALEAIFPPGDIIIDFNEINPRFQEEGEEFERNHPGSGEVVILPGLIIRLLNMR